MEKSFHLAVIGAGASGLTAAAAAAETGKTVIVIDHMQNPAAKILISGGGKCNFSNRNINAGHYFSSNPHFCKSALAGYPVQKFLDFLEKNHISWEEREQGKLFAFSAEAIKDALLTAARTSGAEFLFGTSVNAIEKANDSFLIKTPAANITSEAVLIATGGLSCPPTGASDFGYGIARQFGLKVIPCAPALVPFRFPEQNVLDLSGLSGISVPVQMTAGKKKIIDNLLLTHKGFSGPAGLQTSLYWDPGMAVEINFLPEIQVAEWFKKLKSSKEKRKLSTVLSEKMPQRLAQRFAFLLPENKKEKSFEQLSDKEITGLSEIISKYKFIPAGTDGYNKAEVTKGGIDTSGLLSSSIESRLTKGLFFSGEIIDVTGELGGFNLHWAWASGYAAGKNA